MAKYTGSTEAVMLIAARLARVHVAFTLVVNDEGQAYIVTRSQVTLDAVVEQQRFQDSGGKAC